VTLNGRVSAVVVDDGTATRAGDAAAPHSNVKAPPTIGREAAKGETSSGDSGELSDLAVAADRAVDTPLASAGWATAVQLGDRGEAVVADRAADVPPASADRAVAVTVDQAAVVTVEQAAVAARGATDGHLGDRDVAMPSDSAPGMLQASARGATDGQLGNRAVAMDVDHASDMLLVSADAATATPLGNRGVAVAAADCVPNMLPASADSSVEVAVAQATVAVNGAADTLAASDSGAAGASYERAAEKNLATAGAAMTASNDALTMAAAAATQAADAVVTAVAAAAAVKVAAASAASAAALVVAAARQQEAAAREEVLANTALPSRYCRRCEYGPQWPDQVGHRRGHGRERE